MTHFNVYGTPTLGYEGQKPSLENLKVEVWWDDNRSEVLDGDTEIRAAGFVTVPAVLWASSTNIVSASSSNVTQAAWTPITIYHAATGIGVNSPVTLPGVRAIDTSKEGKATDNGITATYLSGAGLVSGSVASFYEDDMAPILTGVRVAAWYHPIAGNGIPPITTSGASAFYLDANYIFTDYWHGFPAATTGNASDGLANDKRYMHGIDTSEKTKGESEATVYAMISKAPTQELHAQAYSQTKYVKVPVKKLYNINHVIMGDDDYVLKAKGLENDGLGYWFSDDTRFLGDNASLSTAGVITNGTNNGINNPINGFKDTTSGRKYWEDVIKNSTVSFEVHYMGVTDTETKTRDSGMLKRAFDFGNAQVASVPDFRVFEDQVIPVLRLGYFGWNLLNSTNVPNREQWLNYMEFKIPIASFTEAVEFHRPKLTVDPIEIDQRPAAGTTITVELLDSIKATYILRGIYNYDGPGADENGRVYREVPQDLWDVSWFNTGDLRNYNEDEPSVIDLEVTIRRSNNLLAQGFAAYVGLEGTVPVRAIK